MAKANLNDYSTKSILVPANVTRKECFIQYFQYLTKNLSSPPNVTENPKKHSDEIFSFYCHSVLFFATHLAKL